MLPAGLPCDFEHSLCHGRNEMCIGRGPAFPDYFKSNEIIATRQAAKAQELLLAASEELAGVLPPYCPSCAYFAPAARCAWRLCMLGR